MSRRPTKPGEWWLVGAISLLVIGPVLLMITHESEQQLAALAADGIVAQAQVASKTTIENQSSGRRGRQRSTTSYMLTMSYDVLSHNRYAEWQEGAAYVAPAQTVRSINQIEVSQPSYDRLDVGDETMVAMIPHDSASMELASEVEALANGWQNIVQKWLSVAAIIGGAAMLFMGLRARFGWFR